MLLNARLFFWAMVLFCILLLFMPIFIREKYSEGLFIGSESYRSLRIANDIKNGEDIGTDRLSYGGRLFVEESAWYYLLSLNPENLARYLPAVFGLLSFILFYFIANHIKPSVKGVSSLLLVISPPYLYLFSSATKYAAAMFFILLGFYLFLKDRKWLCYLSFFAAGIFSVFSLFAVSIIFLFRGLWKRNFLDFVYIFSGFVILFLVYFRSVFVYGFPSVFFTVKSFSFSDFFSYLFFGFGSSFGLGFFFFILTLIGIYSMFEEKYYFVLVYIILGFLLFISFYANFLLPYLLFILAFYAGRGFMLLLDHEWRSNVFKFLTILIVCCGLLFSLVVFADRVNDFYPGQEYAGAVSFLRNSGGDYAVFSDYRNGELISYSGKKNFMDMKFAYAPGILERIEAYEGLLNSRDIERSLYLMDRYEIKYILIDERMRNEIFDHEEDGILFLLKYSPLRFSIVYSNNKIEIWERI